MKNSLLLISVIIFPLSAYSQVYSTPKGTNITAFAFTYSYTQAELNASQDYVETNFSNIEIVENATNDYNCHGWAWLYSEGGARIGITTPGDDKFWEDRSYYPTSSTSGEKISYQGDHSAIQAGSGLFESKWGQGPRVIHTPLNVPSGYISPGTNLNYYDCNFLPQLQSARLDWGSNYSGSPIVIPTTVGSHYLSIQTLNSNNTTFTALDPQKVTVSNQGYQSCTVTLLPGTGNFGGRVNVGMSNSCATTASYVIITKAAGMRLIAYPNPTNNSNDITVSLTENGEEIETPENINLRNRMHKFYIYDFNGNIVQDLTEIAKKNEHFTISTQNLTKGTYHLKVIYENGQSDNFRLEVGVK